MAKILIILLFILVLITIINIAMPKTRFNLNISWLVPFSFHPFFSVSKNWSGYYKNLEHEETHLKQQTHLGVVIWMLLYTYYCIRGMFKYGFKKTQTLWLNDMSKGLKKPLAKWYVYNPLETEAFIREDKKMFEKVYPEYKDSKVNLFSHRLEIYKF